MFLIFGLLAGLASVGLLGGAVWNYFKGRQTMQNRVAVNGTVVELVQRNTSRSHIFCPVVEYSLPSGEKMRFTSEFGTLPASHKIGDVVKVRYDPANPQQAEIESGMSLWLGPLIMVFMGTVACCLSVFFIVFYWLGFSPK